MKKPLLTFALLLALGSPDVMAANPVPAPAGAGGPKGVEALEVPDAVLAEMNKLVEQAVQGAAGPLQTGDEFTPYGVIQNEDGTLQMLSWNKPNPPPALEIFRQIFLTMRAEAASRPQVVAAVTVAPTSVPTTDGAMRVNMIRAEVDHRRGAPRMVLIPYTRASGKLELGTPVYKVGTNAVFDHSAQLAAAAKAAKAAKKPAKPAATVAPAAKTGQPAGKH